ncbi:hypothetical protein ACFYNO_13405 [Kitasatospora sp. NPDC006697]|uniref:hypothetical protein n=1 Tax=Kitasatospora sp. NPDC006697 TaxID=3364020 RepID=UPI0036C24515
MSRRSGTAQPTARFLLAPVQHWRTRRLVAAHGSISYAVAWCLVELARSPSELPYVHDVAARLKALGMPPPGVSFDSWDSLPFAEQHRRLAWLKRHGATPLAALGVTRGAIERARLHVVEWGLPARHRGATVTVGGDTSPG